MSTGLGLRPWYLQGFDPVQPISSVAPAPTDSAPEGALRPVAEAPSCELHLKPTALWSPSIFLWALCCMYMVLGVCISLLKHLETLGAAHRWVAPAPLDAAPEGALSPSMRLRACLEDSAVGHNLQGHILCCPLLNSQHL